MISLGYKLNANFELDLLGVTANIDAEIDTTKKSFHAKATMDKINIEGFLMVGKTYDPSQWDLTSF